MSRSLTWSHTITLALLVACGASPLRIALEAEDLAASCRAAHEWGVDSEERREFETVFTSAIAGEVSIAPLELDLWRFEAELRQLPDAATFHAGMPTLALRGKYVLSVMTIEEVDALLPSIVAEDTLALSPECQPAVRPRVGQIWVRGFPRLQKALSVGRGRYRDPTPTERAAQQRALAEWEAGEAERTTRCADEIAAARETLHRRNSEAEAARTATRERFRALLTPQAECPTFGDENAAWPVGVRCVYVLRAERGERRDFPSELKFTWNMSVDIDGCRMRSDRIEFSSARGLVAGIEYIFDSPVSLAPTATSWH